MKQKPTESELEILQILWKESPASVRDVNDAINLSRTTGYTTTLKFLQIMHDKGLVSREKSGKQHFYSPAISQEKAQSAMLDRFMETTFGGSTMQLVMQALGSKKTSKEELNQIREYLNNMEGDES